MSMVNYVQQRYSADPQPGLRHRRLLRRDDDQRPAGRLPRRVQGRRGLHGRAVRLLRHHRRLAVEQRLRQRHGSSRPRSSGATWSAAPIPGYTGARPRMQLWHGTEDTTLRYPNFGEEIKQWTNVLGRQPDPRVHRHARSPAGPAPGTAAPATHGARRGDQHPGRRAQPSHERHGRAGHPVLRPGPVAPPPLHPPLPLLRPPPPQSVTYAGTLRSLPRHLHHQRLEHRIHHRDHHHQHRRPPRSPAGPWPSPSPAVRRSPPPGTPPSPRPPAR